MSGSKGQEIVEKLLTFIEMVSNRKLKFSSIVDMNTGKTSDPTDRMVAAVDAALRAAKAEGAREAIKVCRDRMLLWQSHGGAKLASPHSHLSIEGEYQVIIDDLDARAAQIEEGA